MEESTVIAIIAIILSGIGITGGFIYNAHSIKQNTKTRYYQILKNIQDDFNRIDSISPNDRAEYAVEVKNFTIFISTIVRRGMIPKEYIFPHFGPIFSDMLWIVNQDKPKVIEGMQNTIKFCQENNIQERIPIRYKN